MLISASPSPRAGVPASALSPTGEGNGDGSLRSPEGARGDCVGMESEVWAVWGELKESRKWPEFSRNIWANELGFASYRRLYRACVSVYGKTPFQLEVAIIREELESAAKGTERTGGTERGMDKEVDWIGDGLKGVEQALREIGRYNEEEE